MGIVLLEEELPEEAHIDGGLCKVGGELVLYVSPTAPPWRRAEVLLERSAACLTQTSGSRPRSAGCFRARISATEPLG